MQTIVPTIGRQVHYIPTPEEELGIGPLAATVVRIYPLSERSAMVPSSEPGVTALQQRWVVNVAVLDEHGNLHQRTTVPLYQFGDIRPGSGAFCLWPQMPAAITQAQAQGLEAMRAIDEKISTSVKLAGELATEVAAVSKRLDALEAPEPIKANVSAADMEKIANAPHGGPIKTPEPKRRGGGYRSAF